VTTPEHPIQVEGNQYAQYFSDKETTCYGVTIPYERPKAGSAHTTILCKFIRTWNPVLIVITLQSPDGQVLGRGCFEVRVSPAPVSERIRDEEKALEGKTVVCESQLELIRCVSKVSEVLSGLISDVLNMAQYEDIMSEPTDVLRMQKLFEEVLIGNEGHQTRFYRVLQRTNRCFMNKLFGGHFIERHKKQLIEKVSGMDIILSRLLGFILNDDDYRRIGSEQTDAGMMAKLLELMPGWDRVQKDQLYRELIETNGTLITALEAKAEEEEKEECQLEMYEGYISPWMSNGEYLVEGHQEELIRCAVGVDVVVEFLEICAVMTFHQMQDIRGGHFVDRHREELIERVTEIPLNQLRGSALDEKQYEALLNCATEKMQMEALFQMVQEWNRQQKDQLYRALAETNPDVVKDLEEEHFIEKHKEEVIQQTHRVNTVLRWLHDPHLQRLCDQHSPIEAYSDERKMRALYKQVQKWNRKQKDHLYTVLKKTNGTLIADLEGK
ncbi:UNVERIFIED_CONTAM: hypothetical protein K2H54_036481, partial [Gekko kuhli]